LAENCAEAKGEQSEMFFSVTVEKALDNMTETEMIERKSNGFHLTEQGRRDLLVKGDGATGARKVVDDSGAGAKEAKEVAELRAAFEADRARTQAEIDDLPAQIALQPRSAPRPARALLGKNEAKLRALGVNVAAPQLLMEMEELEWSVDEFLKKAGDFAPTLVLIRMKYGTECGGVAGVPWPKKGKTAADPAKGSFIFSLGATPARFDLVTPGTALYCDAVSFGFGGGGDLVVLSDGNGCGSFSSETYAGPRGKRQFNGGTTGTWYQSYERGQGQLIEGTAKKWYEPCERWELWRL
jgi:hypothetical protein